MTIHLCLFILPPVSQPGKGSRETLRGTFSYEKAMPLTRLPSVGLFGASNQF